ncbi:MAG: DUF362 domain-containing protein [Candidatus Omnitrophota bacterium]|nr:MAG: DUF362 domain-containing protein [Candidatus Omnitrophota bacterium]
MSQVYFKRGTYQEFLAQPQKILDGIKKSGFLKEIKKDEFIGLKIHFGEKGNKSYINPALLSPLARFLNKRGARPFLFDTNTLYRGERTNSVDHIRIANKHGFGKLDIPIIIGDGLRGNDYLKVKCSQKHLKDFYLAQILKDIDFVLVFSHFTCHMLTGFGAAIKNMGMGCASRRGKLSQHCVVSPNIKEGQCVKCGMCAKFCPADAISEGKDAFFIDEKKCIGCAQCISVCPHGAVKISWSESYDELAQKMVEYAFAATQNRKCAYVNFCIYITKECDCMNKEKSGFIKDLGVLFSWDPVSIDKASIDLLLQREKHDVFKDAHPSINYLRHLEYAQEIGLGELGYKLIEI